MADAELLGVAVDKWILFVIVVAVSVVVARLIYVLIRRSLDQHITKRTSKNIARLIEYVILLGGLNLGIFGILGFNLTALLASAGVAGIAIAFASQQIIQNFMAGLLMGVDRRIQLEDWVEIVNSSVKVARVRDISLTKTILLDPTGKQVYVPNSVLINSQVINYTKAGFVEVPVEVKIPSNAIERMTGLILEVANVEGRVLPNVNLAERNKMEAQFKIMKIHELFDNLPPLELFKPRVLVSKIDGNDVFLSIRLWIMEVQKRDEIVSSFLKHLIEKCNKEGVCFEPLE